MTYVYGYILVVLVLLFLMGLFKNQLPVLHVDDKVCDYIAYGGLISLWPVSVTALVLSFIVIGTVKYGSWVSDQIDKEISDD